MNPIESLRIALVSLTANKLRSALTMLGVIIGVASVIALMAIGRGTSAGVSDRISGMGTNLLFVTPGSTTTSGVRSAMGSAATLTYQDALALVDPDNAPAVAAVAPQVESFGQLVYQSNNTMTRVIGTTADFATVRSTTVAVGDFITAAQVNSKATVVVLGANVVSQLFAEDQDPIGQNVRINNINFKVVGVLESSGSSSMGSQDDQVIVPITTAMARLSRSRTATGTTVSQISVQIADESRMDAAIAEIQDILRQRHKVSVGAEDFTVQSQESLLESATQVTDMLTFFLGGVAGISLLVGGIGVMNIMLVSVTERTREIGIRKAIGATRQNVLWQFLSEATLLSVMGGLIGVALGWAVAKLISGLSLGSTTITAVVQLDSILLATGFALATGLFFGIYPAYRAASLNPIDALHFE
jgi:putative ABC transport system permease protein